jgi:hypothetical protein
MERGNTSTDSQLVFSTSDAGTLNDALIINESGDVGIGTTSPGAKLDVKSSSSNSIPFQVTNSSDTDAIFSVLEEGGGDGRARIFNAAGTINVNLDSSGNSFFNGGNVGIGTTSPQSKLHVDAGSSDEVARFVSTDNKAYITISDDDTTGYVSSENGLFSLGRNAGVNAANININASNNVGIGTTGPSEKLDVNGNINIRSTASGIRGIKRNDDGYNLHLAGGSSLTGGSYIEVNGGSRGGVGNALNGEINFISGGSYQSSQSAVVGNYNFKTQWNGGSATLMHIDSSSGNVGIGTTSPSQKLDVAGNIKMNETAATTDTDKFVVSDSGILKYRTGAEIRSDIDAIGGSGTAGTIPVFTSGGTDLTDSIITQTSLPNKITIGGELSLQGSGDILNISHYSGATWFIDTSTGDDILFGAPAANTQNVGVQGDLYAYGGDLGTKNLGSFNNLISRTGNSYFNAGNVGIGTTSPNALLDVDGTIRYDEQIASNSTGGAKAFIAIDSGSGAAKYKVYKNTNTTDGYARFKLDRAYDYGNNDQMVQEAIYQRRTTTKNVRFRYDGDITTTDDSYLEFYELTDGTVEGWVCVDDFSKCFAEIYYDSDTSETYPNPSSGTPTGTLIYSTNPDTETPNWDSYQGNGYFSSNVGIGTTSPGKKLDINGDTIFRGELVIDGDSSVHSRINQTKNVDWYRPN